MENAARLVAPSGQLHIALYNDQGATGRIWWHVKRLYNTRPWLRPPLLGLSFVRIWGLTLLKDALRGTPFESWRRYGEGSGRGMSPWRDVVDWVGGFPFEVIRPERVEMFYRNRGFRRVGTVLIGSGYACNMFLFKREAEE